MLEYISADRYFVIDNFFFFFFFEESHRQLYVALSRAKTAAFFLGQNLVKIAFNIY